MLKIDELSNPQSCLSRAELNEMLFVLLGRDVAAPETIRFWAQERIRKGRNKPDDSQIVEAISAAKYMETQGRKPANVTVPRLAILQWRAEWINQNDPKDGTDCVTPFDEFL